MPSHSDNDDTWCVVDEVGGEDALRALLTTFYDALYADLMVGFFFVPHDKQRLIAHQLDYVVATIGPGRQPGRYKGKAMRKAHAHLPILPAHFDRRHVILEQTLRAHQVPERVRRAWLAFDASLKPLIVRTGGAARAEMLSEKDDTKGEHS